MERERDCHICFKTKQDTIFRLGKTVMKGLAADEKCFAWKVQQDMLAIESRMHRQNAERRCLITYRESTGINFDWKYKQWSICMQLVEVFWKYMKS